MKIVQITDTHLLGVNGSLFGIDPSLRLRYALDSIVNNHQDASFVVITGDIANSGDIRAYEELKSILKDFPVRVHLIPGNHDKKEYLEKFFELESVENSILYDKVYDDKAFVFLDSTVKGEEFGAMDENRLSWLKQTLLKHKGKEIYLFMHHFPLRSNLLWMDKHANFRSYESFFDTIVEFEDIKHIFCGHLHRIIDARYKHISISCTRSTTFQVAYKPGCEDDFLTNEENPAYCVAILEKDTTLLHHHEFLSEELIYPGEQW
ncbi:MAG: hypothetical protein GXO12_05645 [Epsilonproteobacteria bacterium]|nr:hypothetical protein [Campylobacterota bacterium]